MKGYIFAAQNVFYIPSLGLFLYQQLDFHILSLGLFLYTEV